MGLSQLEVELLLMSVVYSYIHTNSIKLPNKHSYVHISIITNDYQYNRG
jgi:hypothetical protein